MAVIDEKRPNIDDSEKTGISAAPDDYVPALTHIYNYERVFGKPFSSLNKEEKREYIRRARSAYETTKNQHILLRFYTDRKQDMFSFLFLKTCVLGQMQFIKNLIFDYIKNNKPEFFSYFSDFNFDDNYTPTFYKYLITYRGVTNTVKAWANLIGITRNSLHKRVFVDKMPVLKALTSVTPNKYNKHIVHPKTDTKEKLDAVIDKIKKGEIDFPLSRPIPKHKKKKLDTSIVNQNIIFQKNDLLEMNEDIMKKLRENPITLSEP